MSFFRFLPPEKPIWKIHAALWNGAGWSHTYWGDCTWQRDRLRKHKTQFERDQCALWCRCFRFISLSLSHPFPPSPNHPSASPIPQAYCRGLGWVWERTRERWNEMDEPKSEDRARNRWPITASYSPHQQQQPASEQQPASQQPTRIFLF